METQDIFLTNDGLQHAMNQLEFLRTVKRAEIAQYLHDAKESGDVIDNAAYEEAKNLHAHLEGRITELESMVARAKLIDNVHSEVVTLGSTVHLETENGRKYTYKLVGAFEDLRAAAAGQNSAAEFRDNARHLIGVLLVLHRIDDARARNPIGRHFKFPPQLAFFCPLPR